jgi:hypothetical protein
MDNFTQLSLAFCDFTEILANIQLEEKNGDESKAV